ncbi:erythromycin esterase family protein [Denitratisoma oestradiolicum]|uniref:Erythromycin esterase n=1 Tax=Denitratisoma oestradiolicum TaxID=311182 RepID=A0A6S6XWZ7_9PROT|nr:erythromycin esterase family protein [Denitratisoma oestradiolicum]TWO81912.1 hypothetical protein CBW56_00215 [Denitratisoma oestradiolicum]CAB1368803.1 conserved protein of unknown function [Denitratisoma oestradiolicum]
MIRISIPLLMVWALGVSAAPPSVERTLSLQISVARPLTGGTLDYDELLNAMGDVSIVLLGEATHGSREFYRERARITRRLIEEKGFDGVVLEAPWEPVRRLDAYIAGGLGSAEEALAGFARYPRWPWRNQEVLDFARWLRVYNETRPDSPLRVFGMDLYSVPESAGAVAAYLDAISPAEAATAREDYRCFSSYLDEPQEYGLAVVLHHQAGCGAGVRRQLAWMQLRVNGVEIADEALFAAWQSAHTVASGEAYYRAVHQNWVGSWNLRETHLADTLDRLRTWLGARLGREARLVVWAHNTHQGDARATDQAVTGELSLGQLMRERHGDKVFLVGLTTYHGQVRASSEWGGRDRVKNLRPARRGSWSALLHQARQPALLMVFAGHPALAAAFGKKRLDRAVGVNYLPGDERAMHYYHVRLSRQFDAVIHWDRTTPLVPLEGAHPNADGR